jgi:hypothetical protein
MGPRIAVYRKGENLFLSLEGEFNHKSFQEMLSVVRQMLMTLLKCAAPGSQVTYSFKTRGKVDLEKLAQVQEVMIDQPCHPPEVLKARQAEAEHSELQEDALKRWPRNGLILVKGGAF